MKVLVTGSNGLIGSSLCAELRRRGDEVVACSRATGYDAAKPVAFDFSVDAIVHAASPASPDLFVSHADEVRLANTYGLEQLLNYAREFGVRKVVYVSSSEVYGKADPRPDGFEEPDCGYINPDDPRSSYPLAKRAAEAICVEYAQKFSMDVSVVRPGHVYGPTCQEKDKRVSSAFPWLAARGHSIVMKSDGAQIRSYTHADDCARAIVTVMESGLPGEAYNIAARCGKCSIREMAEIVARAGGVALKFELPTGVEKANFNPMNNSCLNPSKIESLGWHGTITPEVGFASTVQCLRERILHA